MNTVIKFLLEKNNSITNVIYTSGLLALFLTKTIGAIEYLILLVLFSIVESFAYNFFFDSGQKTVIVRSPEEIDEFIKELQDLKDRMY